MLSCDSLELWVKRHFLLFRDACAHEREVVRHVNVNNEIQKESEQEVRAVLLGCA